ncbi:MAG: aspartate/glutamate racemase family protein [Bacillota bacterium]
MTKNYGFINNENDNGTFYIRKGQVISGYTVGILLLDVWYPLLPGNVVNASTYSYPVRHKLVPGANQKRMHSGDPTLIDDLIKAGRELEMEGVRAICGACGYFGHFQPQMAAAMNVPVFLTSLVQIPLIRQGLKPGQKIGILCADKPSLTPELMKKCGTDDPSICVIEGLGEEPEFSALLNSDRGCFNNAKIREEVVNAAKRIVQNNSNIGAILLECSDMPPYASEVQKAVNLPVYDFITMINWVNHAVAQKSYNGFM